MRPIKATVFNKFTKLMRPPNRDTADRTPARSNNPCTATQHTQPIPIIIPTQDVINHAQSGSYMLCTANKYNSKNFQMKNVIPNSA
eukprot:1064299-Amphidinium_carterae.1